MTKLRVIGDIHGDYGWYLKTVQKANRKGISTFQIGDFGLGFAGKGQDEKDEKWLTDSLNLKEHNRFGPGNHDNPLHMRSSPMSVGYHKHLSEIDAYWIGGARSYDQDWRTPFVNWWPGEELTYSEAEDAFLGYSKSLPSIMLSHDGPTEAVTYMFPHCLMDGSSEYRGGRTPQILQKCFEHHQPKVWFFGHWHKSMEYILNGTRFVCVGVREYIDIDIPGWDGKWL